MKKIHVIGGSGFIGSRLVERLIARQDFDVDIIDKSPSVFFSDRVSFCDVRDEARLSELVVDGSVLVNLAAEHRDDVRPTSLYRDVNVNGARSICAIAELKNVRTIVFTSSVAIYGFAPVGTGENGAIAPFNEYGRSKFEAETVFKEWQAKSPFDRSLVIVRPTVVFGERNRGNVFNLLNQIWSGRFIMVGRGENRKSLAYVDNVAAFLEFGLDMGAGVHIYNYVDKPDFTMNRFVETVAEILERRKYRGFRLPVFVGLSIGYLFDFFAFVFRRQFSVSSVRVRKFCSDSVYETAIDKTGFMAPVPLHDALDRTVRYEFVEGLGDREVLKKQ